MTIMPTMTPEEIISIRERLGVDQAGLAKLVGVSQSAISRWEDGKREPRAVQRLRLEKLLKKGKVNGKAKR